MIENLRKVDQRKAEQYESALKDTFLSENGLKALELLEKSVLYATPPLGVDDRALREIHGQRHLISEIRRLISV